MIKALFPFKPSIPVSKRMPRSMAGARKSSSKSRAIVGVAEKKAPDITLRDLFRMACRRHQVVVQAAHSIGQVEDSLCFCVRKSSTSMCLAMWQVLRLATVRRGGRFRVGLFSHEFISGIP
ncbi:hypothetical protein [Bordetella sp. BOR01]|uniref:hypothetical protein n=1 Tax=Bordetella sp. BOR01 TaxID=2854779 RepID=UPI001C46B2C7|nr:hypothetical protein [Bordetella sp. BOR01]MBV7481677.1 hypothetical protein [Bordetella sp. BOR01]